MNPKLRIERLRKSYGAVVALAETSLDLPEGEFLTLLGPSGSGKTTLLMMVAGLIPPDGGEIWIDGREVTRQPPWERDIGMVFQNYALFPHLTVSENIAFPLRMRRRPEAEIRQEVERVLGVVRLPHVGDRLPTQLSGGQQQRIALARCLVYRPSIILMDEPLGALDKKLRDQLQIEIKQLHAELGTTILYVTHDQGETLTMSDRICLMREGRIEQIGTPQELYFQPRTVFAADFLGESNILKGRVMGEEQGGATFSPAFNPVLRLRARPSSSLGGGEAALMVRPERIILADSPAGEELRGTVRTVIFVGATTKYSIDVGGGTALAVSETTRPGAMRHPGTSVGLRFAPEDAVLLPVE